MKRQFTLIYSQISKSVEVVFQRLTQYDMKNGQQPQAMGHWCKWFTVIFYWSAAQYKKLFNY